MLLLDTCAMVWLASDHSRLSPTARAAIAAEPSSLHVCSISAFEIGLRYGERKILLPSAPDVWFPATLRLYGIRELPVSWEVALRSTQLPWIHRDPADRIIVAASLLHNLSIVTPDPFIQGYPAIRILWRCDPARSIV